MDGNCVACKDNKQPFRKGNMYQLVYNEFDDDSYLRSIHGDGYSSDLNLSSNQRIAKLLGLSDSWSVGDNSSSGDTELWINSLEDTFEKDVKEARIIYNQLDTSSPIAGSSNQNRFEDNADFSIYKSSPCMHSTPIKPMKHSDGAMDGFIHANLTNICSDISTNILVDVDNKPYSQDVKDNLIVETPTEIKDTTETLDSAKTSTPIKRSFVWKLRNSLKRKPLSSNELSGTDVEVKCFGPMRFQLDSSGCFFDDDVVHLCQSLERRDDEFGKMFEKVHHSTQVDASNRVPILPEQVEYNTDDDYEDALSQDPSNDVWRNGGNIISPPEKRNLSTSARNWLERHSLHLLISSIVILIVIIFVVVLRHHYNILPVNVVPTNNNTLNLTTHNISTFPLEA